jgi:hypothetical protein
MNHDEARRQTLERTVHSPWIGVDMDGTLAIDDGWRGPHHVGDPVPLMLARVLHWLAHGKDVRILTARVASTNPGRAQSREAIRDWCRRFLGREIPITAEKDDQMIEFWDDRCIQVEPNTGVRVQPQKARVS